MDKISALNALHPASKTDEIRLGDAGFRWGQKGAHTSRTIMFNDLHSLLAYCSPDANRAEYLSAIRDQNCLGKRTSATRKLSSQRLSELYALDSEVPLFRLMRQFWYSDPVSQEILAMLTALTRDPLLRMTASVVVPMQPGDELSRKLVVEAIGQAVGERLSTSTIDKVVRNAASSWTQSGHLKGRSHKIRQLVVPTPICTVYALLIGYLTGVRGAKLFETFWTQVLDASPDELMRLALSARRMGLLEMNNSGGVIDVSFKQLLGREQRA